MVNTTQPPHIPEANLTEEPFLFQRDPDDEVAITIVRNTFQEFESDRFRNYDSKWLEIDSLYEGVVPVRTWTGSPGVKRSAIPDNIAFDHVEGAVPRIESALFDNPEWFSVEAMEETSPQDARDMQVAMDNYLTLPYDNTFTNAMTELRLGIRSCVKYGTGMGLLEWENSRPKVTNLDIRDVFVDPGTNSPHVDRGRAIMIRSEITIDELARLREQDDPRLNIPADDMLRFMLSNRPGSTADNTKQQSAMAQGVQYVPGQTDQIPLPESNKIELIQYYDMERIIFTLNRVWIMFKGKNHYGFFPIVAFPCRISDNKLYGKGYPEAIRYQQRTAEALRNNHIDMLHLNSEPAVTGPPNMKSKDMVIYPGRTSTTDRPGDVVVHEPPGPLQNTSGEVAELHAEADRRNGLSGLSQGNARPGNINRTKAGVTLQAEGTDVRLKHVAANIEEFGIVPMLYKIRRMVQVHTMPDQVLIPAYPVPNGQPPYRAIRADVFHKPARFKMTAASKMLTRERLGSLIQPVMQALINGPVLSGLSQAGMIVDFEQFAHMVQDAAGLSKRYSLVRPMNEEEKKAMQEPPPQVKAQMQGKQMDLQLRDKVAGMKYQTEMADVQAKVQAAQIAKQPVPKDPQESQMKMQEMQMKLQATLQQVHAKMAADQQKAQTDQQSAQAKVQSMQQMAAIKAQQAQQDMEAKQQMHMMDHAAKAQGAQLDAAVNQQTAQMDLQATSAHHTMSLKQMQEQGDMKRQQMALQALSKPKTPNAAAKPKK